MKPPCKIVQNKPPVYPGWFFIYKTPHEVYITLAPALSPAINEMLSPLIKGPGKHTLYRIYFKGVSLNCQEAQAEKALFLCI